MNYEEKYKEGLAEAMKHYNSGCATEGEKRMLERLYSELKESEDERIRKEIIDWMKGGNTYDWQENKGRWIAWLEKQGEQNPILPGIEDCEGVPGKDYIPTEWVDTCERYGVWKIARVDEQKPAEWSEEDERMLEPIISDLRGLCNCETDEELISDYEDRIAWLKSLRPKKQWKPSEEQMITLRHVISGCSYDIEPLVKMEEQLKKLRGKMYDRI